MQVQGLLGNMHKLQTSPHRSRILIVVFELQKCSLQFSLSKPALHFEAVWFSCTSNLLISLHDQSLVREQQHTPFLTDLACLSLDKTRQELKCLLALSAFPVIWLHDGDVPDGIKPSVSWCYNKSRHKVTAQQCSWRWSAGSWVQLTWELGRRNNSTVAAFLVTTA